MPVLRVLSGKQLVRIFERFGFSVVSQKGSHVKMRRISSYGSKQTLVIPEHREIARGTLQNIYKQALHYIDEKNLTPYFYE